MATIIEGTNGRDVIYQDWDEEVEVYAYGGNDDIYLNLVNRYGGYNYVEAGSGDDYVQNGFEGGNDIYLGSGNDLYVHDGIAIDYDSYDRVFGESGNDTFEVETLQSDYYGGSGKDVFKTAGYNNYFDGGDGVDTINYSLQDSTELEGIGVYLNLDEGFAEVGNDGYEEFDDIENATGTGWHDTIIGTAGANVLKGLNGEDQLEGLEGDDDLYGGNGNDTLYGDDGYDNLFGEKGHDDLYGGTGEDDLSGGKGYDNLSGGKGRDVLIGGLGSDLLNGGKGADNFDFNSVDDSVVGSNRDEIVDFNRGQGDVIDLSGIDANENSGGNQSFDFIGTSGFSGTARELRYNGHIIAGDVDGDGSADFQIEANLTQYFADDFVL
ncbi:calcium-binding protein [Rhizobium sp. TRM95111]|uniref:calcium-binding protein n=1 Tax=Rhizobium alarense TaxID=2846851 RepID=UPI001F21DE58|nr:calcium-binding protein [Rhizobium alarense]MCF3642697.1 calcium-binding protein [Rhizobium alarense]